MESDSMERSCELRIEKIKNKNKFLGIGSRGITTIDPLPLGGVVMAPEV